MRNTFLIALAVVGMSAGATSAADLPRSLPVLSAAPATLPAQSYRWYVGLKGGAGPFVADNDFYAPPTAFRDQPLNGSVQYRSGYSVAAEAGFYLSPNWRAGVELAYAGLEPHALRQGVFAPYRDTLRGDIEVYSAFAEAAYEFGPIGVFRPYLKFGVGVVHVALSGVTSSPTFVAGVADSEDNVLAARIGAGAAIAVTDTIDFVTEYDFTVGQDAQFAFSFPTFPGVAPAPFEVEVAAHRAMLGLRLRF